VTITYPTTVPPELGAVVEQVDAKPVHQAALNHWELTGHAFLAPLGPGDNGKCDVAGNVVEVVHLEPQFIYHVDLHLPADFFAGPLPDIHPARRISERLFGEWERDTWVTVMTDFVCVVSSQSEKWINDKVRSSKYVEGLTCTRTPDTTSVPLVASPVL
jgi:hypothetical protein